MGVTYKKLFKLMIDCGLKKKDLQEMACLSPATISKLGRDDYVSMDVLVRICNALKVRIEDIVEVLIED